MHKHKHKKIAKRHPSKKPILILDSFQTLNETLDGHILIEVMMTLFHKQAFKPIGFPIFIEMSDDLFFHEIHSKYERDFVYVEVKEFTLDDLSKIDIKMNENEMKIVYDKLGGNPMKWATFYSHFGGRGFDKKRIEDLADIAAYSSVYYQFVDDLSNTECVLHYEFMKIFKNHEFKMRRDQIKKLNLKFMAIKAVQNNIMYFNGKVYRPQNKPIQSLMSIDGEMDAETIKEICQTSLNDEINVNLEPSIINLPSPPDNHKTEM